MYSQELRITKLILQETGTYNPIYERPFESKLDGVMLDQISERLYNSKNDTIGEGLFSGIANNTLSPSAIPGSQIQIPNGWDTKRNRFFMVVEWNPVNGTGGIYYYQGFTDRPGVTLQGNIDPEMTFYINSYIKVVRGVLQSNTGEIYNDSVVESAQVINNELVVDYANGYEPLTIYTSRPTDMFSAIQSAYLQAGYASEDQVNIPFTDSRNILNDNITSSRRNSNPASYISSIVSDYKRGLSLVDYGQYDSEIYDRSKDVSLLKEGTLRGNPLFRSISNIKGYGSGISFNFNDLETIDPGVTSVTDCLLTNSDHLMHSRDSESWNTATLDAQIASTIASALPGILIENFIADISFTATNCTSDMTSEVTILECHGLTMGFNVGNLNRFITGVIHKLLVNIQDTYMLTINCSIYLEVRIAIQIGGCSPVEYVVPTFCDSMLTPILNKNKATYNNLVSDIETLLESTKDFLV